MNRKLEIHSYLLPLYPILFLYSQNKHFFSLDVLVLPLIAALFMSILFRGVVTFVFKSPEKARLLTSFVFVMFFSYGHISNLKLLNIPVILSRMSYSTEILSLMIWGAIFVIGVLLVTKLLKKTLLFSKILNGMAIFLTAVLLIEISYFHFSSTKVSRKNISVAGGSGEVLGYGVDVPDIYYIILDGYGRQDVLSEVYNYDNSSFLDFLSEKGFYIATKSTTNYVATALSLTSSLNLDHVNNILQNIDTNSNDRSVLHDAMKNNAVASYLTAWGYEVRAISSGYYGTEVNDIDLLASGTMKIGEFEGAVINFTPVPALLNVVFSTDDYSVANIHRETLLRAYRQMPEEALRSGPQYIFVHLLSPHPPFVFDKDGNDVKVYESFGNWDGNHLVDKTMTKEKYILHYAEQAEYISKLTEDTISEILRNSGDNVIIILQSDHGPGSMLDWESADNTNLKERFSILNAYYFPDKDYSDLYENITPVNSFRVLFNKFMDADYEILEDKNYFSTFTYPYQFSEVTGQLEDVGAR